MQKCNAIFRQDIYSMQEALHSQTSSDQVIFNVLSLKMKDIFASTALQSKADKHLNITALLVSRESSEN